MRNCAQTVTSVYSMVEYIYADIQSKTGYSTLRIKRVQRLNGP